MRRSQSLDAAWRSDAREADVQAIVALRLSPPEVTGAWLPRLPSLVRLRQLGVCGGAFTDKHVATVAALPELDRLCLHGTGVSEAAVQALAASRPDLSIDVRPLDITFADLAFDDPAGPNAPVRFTGRSIALDGSLVRIRGHMFPTRTTRALRFTLIAKDHNGCRHGTDPLCERVDVELKFGETWRSALIP